MQESSPYQIGSIQVLLQGDSDFGAHTDQTFVRTQHTLLTWVLSRCMVPEREEFCQSCCRMAAEPLRGGCFGLGSKWPFMPTMCSYHWADPHWKCQALPHNVRRRLCLLCCLHLFLQYNLTRFVPYIHPAIAIIFGLNSGLGCTLHAPQKFSEEHSDLEFKSQGRGLYVLHYRVCPQHIPHPVYTSPILYILLLPLAGYSWNNHCV